MKVQYTGKSKIDYLLLPGSDLVGRQHELALIGNRYKAARDGYSRVVLLVGELGIGKTCILNEVAARALDDRASVLRGGASESEGMPPYLPFLEALGEYIRLTPSDQLRKQVAQAPQILASILPELADRLGELPEFYRSLPEQARLRLYVAVGTFLETISMQRVVVLVLDDLHWADSASLDLLCYILQHHSKARLLILGAYRESKIDRNPALDRAMNELVRQRVLTRIAVHPLSSAEIEELAVNYLGAPISSTISQLLYEQSEGNPFFAEELIRNWIETGALLQENNRWVATSSPFLQALPPNIVGILRQRFSRISPNIIDHLRIAAIIGRTFDISMLASVENLEVETIEEHMLEAMHAGLVRADQNGNFTFSHDKIRECLYAEVSTSRRQRLHEIIGRKLEARYDQKNPKNTYQLAELAFHFTRSGDQARGATYSQLAAEQAVRSSAFNEAMIHYRRALELLDTDDERRGNLLLNLGETTLVAGVNGEAAIAYEAALTCLLRSGELEAAARAAHGLGLAQWRQDALQAARVALERSLELQGNQLSAEVVRVLVDLSTLFTIYMDQHAEGIAYAQRALEVARSLGDRSLEAAATRAVAGEFFMRGIDISGASQLLERAVALAEESDNPTEAAECILYLEGIYYWKAEIRRSYKISLYRTTLMERSRQSSLLWNSSSWTALLLSCQGAWVEAEQAIERAQALVDYLSRPAYLAFLYQIRGFLAYQREDYASAEREFQASMVNQQKGPGWLMFRPAGLLGLTQVAVGKREEAYTRIAELEALAAELPIDSLPTAPILTCLALLAIALGDQEQAADLYPRLLTLSGQHYWFLVDRVLGEIATICGDWEKAMMHLSTAEATARREGLLPELARALLAKAKCEVAHGSPGSTSRATYLLKQALVLFEQLSLTEAAGRVCTQLRLLSRRKSSSPSSTLPAELTQSEASVLHLVVTGKSNRQIAQHLGISEKTVANHLSHIYNKTASENRAAAAAFAIRHGLA